MSIYAEQLFHRLGSANAITALTGQTEDAYLDCKLWPARDEDAQRTFAKAACGLANADGGVLVIGMNARSIGKDEPDLIACAEPVADTSAVKSRVLDLIGQLVEPSIQGIQALECNQDSSSKCGFVLVYIPASDGLPKRSRKDWKFYLRIGSGTFPMEYFQIAEMFGRRPQPQLELYLEPTGEIVASPFGGPRCRFFWLGISNTGRGMAKFPGIRFNAGCGLSTHQFGLDGNGSCGLPRRPGDGEWIMFRGGVDDVIYPESTLKITRLLKEPSSLELEKGLYVFSQVKFLAEISCEGIQSITVERVIPEYRLN